MSKKTIKPPIDLRDACVLAAHAVIAAQGVEKLSMRDVARKLGVSHQAPYKHYPSRDHLLSEVIRRCFQGFAQALNGRPRFVEPIQDMRSLGAQYLTYALEHPLEYRLMFGTPWPPVEAHPELVLDAQHAFNVLRSALTPLYPVKKVDPDKIDSDALFVWSSMHGLATILQSQAMSHLSLSQKVLEGAVGHVMYMVDVALLASVGKAPLAGRR